MGGGTGPDATRTTGLTDTDKVGGVGGETGAEDVTGATAVETTATGGGKMTSVEGSGALQATGTGELTADEGSGSHFA